MRKRLPRMGHGNMYMSDVDRKLLREFQTQGQVGDNISESQLRGLEGAITGPYIESRDVTYTPQEEERFKKLMSGRVGRRFDKGQGARGMGILQRKFPNMSDSDMMNLIDMYTQDTYVNPFNKPMMGFGGTSDKGFDDLVASFSIDTEFRKGGAKKKDWIKGAIKKPGALTATAKRAGAVKKDGTIKKSWLKDKAKGSGKTAQRARLAITLGKMKKKK